MLSILTQTDVLLTVLGCVTGVIIAVIEGRRSPVEESLRYRMDDIHDRITKIEQKYMAYPTALAMLEQWAATEAMNAELMRRLGALESKVEEPEDDNETNNPSGATKTT